MGHSVDAQGLHTLPSKVEAILKAPDPKNLQQLRSFLGLLNYYGKFIPNLASIVYPLNHLLQKDAKWAWTSDCAQAFAAAKKVLNSSQVLAHYDPTLPITMAGDASVYGIGSVISHVLPDGSERPIAFASQTLSTSEKNYCQLEKEALSLVFSVQKFHQYLYGCKFTLITDHKPLLAILGPKKVYLLWLQQGFNAGLFCSQHTTMTSNLSQLQLMRMQMVYHDSQSWIPSLKIGL